MLQLYEQAINPRFTSFAGQLKKKLVEAIKLMEDNEAGYIQTKILRSGFISWVTLKVCICNIPGLLLWNKI